jgi:hypothetical protein
MIPHVSTFLDVFVSAILRNSSDMSDGKNIVLNLYLLWFDVSCNDQFGFVVRSISSAVEVTGPHAPNPLNWVSTLGALGSTARYSCRPSDSASLSLSSLSSCSLPISTLKRVKTRHYRNMPTESTKYVALCKTPSKPTNFWYSLASNSKTFLMYVLSFSALGSAILLQSLRVIKYH